MECRRLCDCTRSMLIFYVNLMSRHSLLLYSVLFFAFTISISGQPLQLPPQRFQCGPVNASVTCERWGYDTCIFDNGEYYCLPCYHDYLTTLCGTQKEIEGCNLYCTQKALDEETERLKANFTEQITNLQTDFSKKEVEFQTERLEMHEELQNRTIVSCSVMAVLCLVVLIVVIVVICWCIRRKRGKIRHGEEDPEVSVRTPLKGEDGISEGLTDVSEETQLKEHNILPDSLEVLKETDSGEQAITTTTTTVTSETEQTGQDNKCPAIKKLGSVPATNRTGNDKLAIKSRDLSNPNTPP